MKQTLKASLYILVITGVILFIISLIFKELTFDEMTYWTSVVLFIIAYVASDKKRVSSFGRLKKIMAERGIDKKSIDQDKIVVNETVEQTEFEKGVRNKESQFTMKNIRIACILVAVLYIAVDLAIWYL